MGDLIFMPLAGKGTNHQGHKGCTKEVLFGLLLFGFLVIDCLSDEMPI